jgi:hypothetical protein
MQERRSKLHGRLIQLWNERAEKRCGCKWGNDRSDIYGRFILKYPLIQLMKFPVSFVIPEIEVTFESLGKENIRCTVVRPGPRSAAHYHSFSEYQQLLFAKLDAMKETAGVVDFY